MKLIIKLQQIENSSVLRIIFSQSIFIPFVEYPQEMSGYTTRTGVKSYQWMKLVDRKEQKELCLGLTFKSLIFITCWMMLPNATKCTVTTTTTTTTVASTGITAIIAIIALLSCLRFNTYCFNCIC